MKGNKNGLKASKNGRFLKMDEASLQGDWEKLKKKIEAMETEENIEPKLRIVRYRPKPSAMEQLKVIVRKIKWKLGFRKTWGKRL